MTFETRLDAIDTRTVFRAYAIAAVAFGFALGAWGPLWLGSDLSPESWPKAVVARMAGAVVMAAGLAGWGLSFGNTAARDRGLSWFIGAHAVVLAVLIAQIRGPLGDPIATQVAWGILAVILGLLYTKASRGGGTRPSSVVTSARPSLEEARTRYEHQIREAAAQEERHRLARDLHDAVKQQIFAMQTAAAAAEARFTQDPAGARDAIAQVRQSAREAMTEMEAMLDQLRAVPLENASLVEAVRKAGEALAFRSGAQVDVSMDGLPHSSAFEPGAHQAIFRVIQEALANIGRHARATSVAVVGRAASGWLTVAIEDDGLGFEREDVRSGMGVQNMRARAEEVGGRFAIDSRAAGGTRVTLNVPYETPEALRSSRQRVRLLAIVFATAAFGGLVHLIAEGLALANAALLLFTLGFAHNLVTARRLTRRLAGISDPGSHG